MAAVTFALIHGAGGDASYWSEVTPLLRERGHDVIAVDLPSDDDAAGLPEYAQTMVDAIGKRDNIALVAQSMAGFTAPLVAQRVPAGVMVLLNAMIPMSGETPGEWWTATDQPAAKREMDIREGRDPDAEFDVHTYFLEQVPRDVLERLPRPRGQSNTPFGSRCTFDRWPDVPIHVIAATDDRLFPVEFQRRVAQERLGIEPDQMPGGHLAALSHPRELAALLTQYTAQLR